MLVIGLAKPLATMVAVEARVVVAATLTAASFSLIRHGCMCRHGSRRDLTGRLASPPAALRHRPRSMQPARQ